MAANKIFRLGPLALTTTLTTNILNPGTLTGGVNSSGGAYANLYIIIKKLRIVNKTGSGATFTLYLGASGGNVAGTEIFGNATNVAANSFFESFDLLRLDVGDFLVGGAGTTTALTLYAEGEIGVA